MNQEKLKSFLHDVQDVYKKHGLFLSHEDNEGAFRVVSLGQGRKRELQLQWLHAATDDVEVERYAAVAYTRKLINQAKNDEATSRIYYGVDNKPAARMILNEGWFDEVRNLMWTKHAVITGPEGEYLLAGGRTPMASAAVVILCEDGKYKKTMKNRLSDQHAEDYNGASWVPYAVHALNLLQPHTGFMSPVDPHVQVIVA